MGTQALQLKKHEYRSEELATLPAIHRPGSAVYSWKLPARLPASRPADPASRLPAEGWL